VAKTRQPASAVARVPMRLTNVRRAPVLHALHRASVSHRRRRRPGVVKTRTGSAVVRVPTRRINVQRAPLLHALRRASVNRLRHHRAGSKPTGPAGARVPIPPNAWCVRRASRAPHPASVNRHRATKRRPLSVAVRVPSLATSVRQTPPELLAVAGIEAALRLPLQPTAKVAAACLNTLQAAIAYGTERGGRSRVLLPVGAAAVSS